MRHQSVVVENLLMSNLSLEDRYKLLIQSLEINNVDVFLSLEEDMVDANFLGMVMNNCHLNKDQDPLAIAIRNSNIDISIFESLNYLNNIFIVYGRDLPQTVDFLFEKAKQAGLWYYVLELGLFKPKKELLRSIVQSKDQQLIEKFFALYNADPEVKHLTIFS